MKNLIEIRESFLKADSKMRLGHLASDLLRIASFIEKGMDFQAIKSVMEEGAFFAEWAAPQVDLDIQMLLAEIQGYISQKQLEWDSYSANVESMEDIKRQLRFWSNELLKRAGFVE